MQAKVEIDGHEARAELVEPFHPVQDLADGVTDLTDLRGLMLRVSFELDNARVTLEELASLDAGSTLELDVPAMEAMVRIVCHGQTVGLGQLVAIGERIGVRIESMGLASGGIDAHSKR